jgi:hypothetical protein
MQCVDPAHQFQVGFAEFLRPIISSRDRQRQYRILPGNRQIAHMVYHLLDLFDLFMLGNPALLSAA